MIISLSAGKRSAEEAKNVRPITPRPQTHGQEEDWGKEKGGQNSSMGGKKCKIPFELGSMTLWFVKKSDLEKV